MAEVLYYAIPFFVLLLVLEALSFRHTRDEADDLIGYDARDTRTSLMLGGGNVAINFVWKFAVVALYALIYELTPLRLDPGDWWVWVLLFFADDFSYYWFHRVSHEARVMFGSFQGEGERVRYGLTRNIRTFSPVRAAFHEYIAMWHDVKRAPRVRDKLGVLFHGPGWTPPGVRASEGTRG